MKQKILTVLSVLFGLMMLNGGINKFFNYMPAPDDLQEPMMNDFIAFMKISWLMPLIAITEIVGGVLFMIPRTRALGALVIIPIMVGILLTHIIVEPSGVLITLILWAIMLWAMWENREKYKPLF